MRVIGHAGGVPLYVPNDAYLSFFNSPYVGHRRGSSLDVYPFDQEWGCDVLSAVDGTVCFIHETRMGRPKEFETHGFDYAIGVCSEEYPSLVVRVMHCRPSIAIGDSVDVGSRLGSTIRSRFFNYWTGPHYHLDVLGRNDFLRSTKSLPINVTLGRTTVSTAGFSKGGEVHVLTVTDDFALADCAGLSTATIGEYSGLMVQSMKGNIRGILDAGVPHYAHGGIVCKETLEVGAKVVFQTQSIGEIAWSRATLHLFSRTGAVEARLGKAPLRGISSFLYPRQHLKKGRPPLVLIPRVLGGFSGVIQEGDTCQLSINTVKAR
jgi:hypothetical protein